MEPTGKRPDPAEVKCRPGLLFIHGITTELGGSFSDNIRSIRLAAREKGIPSFEIGYRGRGPDKANELEFSLDRAASDVVTVIEHLAEPPLQGRPPLSRIMIVARGFGAYIALSAVKRTDVECELALWQPVFFPSRVLEERGHKKAFECGYAGSTHPYVELQGVRLGANFFESVPSDESVYDLLKDGTRMSILSTKGDKVAKWEWIEEFAAAAREKGFTLISGPIPLDTDVEPVDHLHVSPVGRFLANTRELLDSFARRCRPSGPAKGEQA